MAHFLAISVTVQYSQNTQLLHHLHLNKMRNLNQTIPCIKMLLSHNFRKFQINLEWQVPKYVDKSAGKGQPPEQHLSQNFYVGKDLQDRVQPTLLSHCCSTQRIHSAPLNQTPKCVLPAFGGTKSQGWHCPRVISIPSTQICRKWVHERPRYTRLGFLLPTAHGSPLSLGPGAELSTWGDHPVWAAEGWTCKWPWWRWWSACCPCFQCTCLENKPRVCSAGEEQLKFEKWPTFSPRREEKQMITVLLQKHHWKCWLVHPGERSLLQEQELNTQLNRGTALTLSLPKNFIFKFQSNNHRARKELQEREGAEIIRNNTEKQEWLWQLWKQ